MSDDTNNVRVTVELDDEDKKTISGLIEEIALLKKAIQAHQVVIMSQGDVLEAQSKRIAILECYVANGWTV